MSRFCDGSKSTDTICVPCHFPFVTVSCDCQCQCRVNSRRYHHLLCRFKIITASRESGLSSAISELNRKTIQGQTPNPGAHKSNSHTLHYQSSPLWVKCSSLSFKLWRNPCLCFNSVFGCNDCNSYRFGIILGWSLYPELRKSI